jgi:hypothetical protein
MTKSNATAVRTRILRNIGQGRDPFDGFSGSRLGGAMRSVHLWRGFTLLTQWDPKFDCWKLTDKGVKALKTEEY